MWNENIFFENLLLSLQLISYLVAILGIVAIVIQISSFRKNQQKEQKVNEQLLIQNSINVLKVFSEEIIPAISEAERNLPAIQKAVKVDTLEQINAKLPSEQRLTKLPPLNDKLHRQIRYVAKNRAHIGRIFNKLEQITVYMNYGMIKEDLVYIPVHKVFLNFVTENKACFAQLTSDEVPYMNVLKLYNNWQDKHKIELLEKERVRLESELADLKNN